MEKNPEDRVDLQKEIGTKKSLIMSSPLPFELAAYRTVVYPQRSRGLAHNPISLDTSLV